MYDKFANALCRLESWCESEGFKGYDPYDGLNSKFFQSLPFIKHNRIARLLWIQFFKRSPINLRPLLGISKDYNPKAMGLFLSGYCNLHILDESSETREFLRFLSDEI